jgi:hypothetical protein
MRRLLTIATVAVVVTLMSAPSFAQVVANDAYQVGYYDVFRSLVIINTGQIGSPIDPGTKHGTVCADIYLFDANQEMLACCSCVSTANGMALLTGATTLTNVDFTRGVIKVVADAGCDETSITTPVNGGLRAFETNFTTGPAVGLRENRLEAAPLTTQEQQFLGQACSFVHYLGSGKGTCVCGAIGTG